MEEAPAAKDANDAFIAVEKFIAKYASILGEILAAEAVATIDSELVSKQICCNGLTDSLPTFIDSIEPTCSDFGACDISSNVADAFQRTAYSNVALTPTTAGAASTTKADDITSHEKSVSILLNL